MKTDEALSVIENELERLRTQRDALIRSRQSAVGDDEQVRRREDSRMQHTEQILETLRDELEQRDAEIARLEKRLSELLSSTLDLQSDLLNALREIADKWVPYEGKNACIEHMKDIAAKALAKAKGGE